MNKTVRRRKESLTSITSTSIVVMVTRQCGGGALEAELKHSREGGGLKAVLVHIFLWFT